MGLHVEANDQIAAMPIRDKGSATNMGITNDGVSLIAKGNITDEAIDEEAIITFPTGLVGCSDWQRFVVLNDEEAPGLHVMQSLDEPSIRFLITDPRLIVEDYQIKIGATERQLLQLNENDDVVVQCILTARGEPALVTANLLGPLAINPHSRIATQLVLMDTPYSTRHLVLAGNS